MLSGHDCKYLSRKLISIKWETNQSWLHINALGNIQYKPFGTSFSPKKTQISVICTNFRVTFNSVSSNVIYESHSPFQWNLNKPARRHYTGLLKVTCFSCDFSLTEWTYFGVLYSTFVRVISAMNHVSDRVEHSRFKEQWRYHIMEWSL